MSGLTEGTGLALARTAKGEGKVEGVMMNGV
jgi:hypothetical protein